MIAGARVRVVVLNFDGGVMTLDCLDSLLATDWPADRLEIVLVDNASIDGIIDVVRQRYPAVRVIESLENTGFAGGCNLGMGDLAGVDVVALINNDATVDPGWLRPLVAALDRGRRVGAACSKMLFADQVHWVRIDGPAEVHPPDPRRLGVQVSAVAVDGVAADDRVRSDEGVWPAEAAAGRPFRWTSASGEIRVVATAAGDTAGEGHELSFVLSAPVVKTVRITTDVEALDVAVGPDPTPVRIAVSGRPSDVINNAGSAIYPGGYGGDRGFLERDEGQYDEPAEVFAWCGGAVALSVDYLADVGRFDERFFLYYEDTDLSWRGRHRGWHYTYVPTSLVRHRHAQSSGEGSRVFRYHVERNRLLLLAKCAPAPMARTAAREYAGVVVSTVLTEIVRPLARRRRPRPKMSAQRLASMGGFVRGLPAMVRDRRRIRTTSVLPDSEMIALMAPAKRSR